MSDFAIDVTDICLFGQASVCVIVRLVTRCHHSTDIYYRIATSLNKCRKIWEIALALWNAVRKLLFYLCVIVSLTGRLGNHIQWGVGPVGSCIVQAWVGSLPFTMQLVSPHLFTYLGCYLDTVYITLHRSGRNLSHLWFLLLLLLLLYVKQWIF